MMKPLLTAILFCIYTLVQANSVDSLLALTQTSQDTLVAVDLYRIARGYFGRDMDSTLLLMQASKDYSKSIGYVNGEVAACIGLSAVGFRVGDTDRSLKAADHGIKIVEEYDLPVETKVKLLLNKGSALTTSERTPEALEVYIATLQLCREGGLTDLQSKVINNVGIIHRKMGDYEGAVKAYNEGVRLRIESKDTAGLATTYFNRGASYSKLERYVEAAADIQAAEQLYIQVGMVDDAKSCRQALGQVYYEQGELDLAYSELIEVYKAESYNPLPQDKILLNIMLATVALEKGEIPFGEQLVKEAELLVTDGFAEERLELMLLKGEIESLKGNHKKSNELLREYLSAYKESNKDETLRLESEMEAKYQTAEKDFEIDRLSLEQEITYTKLKASRQRSIGLGVGLLILAGLLYRLYRLNGQIKEKNKVITKANADKEILLKEIHHRVKNNLQVVSSLLGLQSRYIKDDKALKAINTGRTRVQSMSILHRKLYQNKDLKSVDVKEYFEDLGDNLFQNYKWTDKQIDFKSNIEQLELDVDMVIPMGLITNELISNALKYAFEGREKGTVSLHIARKGNNIVLEVTDNGVGLPFTEIPAKSESLGMQLIKSFAEKLDATIHISTSDNGSTFALTIPKEQQEQSPI